MDKDELICDVCHQEPAVGVAGIPGIPMSVAYGKKCLEQEANPAWALRANVACCGGPDRVIPEYLELKVWVEGRVITLKQHLEECPMTPEELAGPE